MAIANKSVYVFTNWGIIQPGALVSVSLAYCGSFLLSDIGLGFMSFAEDRFGKVAKS
jgi:hypothetical protein